MAIVLIARFLFLLWHIIFVFFHISYFQSNTQTHSSPNKINRTQLNERENVIMYFNKRNNIIRHLIHRFKKIEKKKRGCIVTIRFSFALKLLEMKLNLVKLIPNEWVFIELRCDIAKKIHTTKEREKTKTKKNPWCIFC